MDGLSSGNLYLGELWILAGTSILFAGFYGFPQSVQLNARIVPQLGYDCFQKVHPFVLAYTFFTVRQNTTISKQLIYITCINGYIEVQLHYMFLLVEPSSGNTCLQQCSQIIELH
jgi:hypothetical protein